MSGVGDGDGDGDGDSIAAPSLYVDDVDAAFNRALDQGASAQMAPNLRPHDDRMAGCVDPCGNTWWIAQPG